MDGDQVLRHLLDALAHAGLRAAPGCPAQVAELGGMAFGWRVTLDLVQPVQGNIDRVPAGILDDQVVALEALDRSEEHTSELQSPCNLVCRLLLEKKKKKYK